MLSFEDMVKQEADLLRRIHPTPDDIPSCTSMIDDFLRSYTPGQQVRALYRYGNISGTSNQKWDDFKYCLSLKAFSAEERREKWIKRRAEWWARRRMERSSEDVWEIRTAALPKWTPQEHSPNAPDVLS